MAAAVYTNDNLAAGTHTIKRASGETYIYYIEWTPNAVDVSGITVDPTTTSVNVDETVTLTATLAPVGAKGDITWTSSDDTKATVANGVVTGVAVTEAPVTITATCGSFSATCEVTVLGACEHQWKEEVTKEATCTEAGEMTKTCESTCKKVETVEIPALGHTWEDTDNTNDPEWVTTTAPTCGVAGVKTQTCGRTVNGVTCNEVNPTTQRDETYEEHTFGEDHICTVCKGIDETVTSIKWHSVSATASENTTGVDFFNNFTGLEDVKTSGIAEYDYNRRHYAHGLPLSGSGHSFTFTAPSAGTLMMVLDNETCSKGINVTNDGATTKCTATDHILTQKVAAGDVKVERADSTTYRFYYIAFLPDAVEEPSVADKAASDLATAIGGESGAVELSAISFDDTLDAAVSTDENELKANSTYLTGIVRTALETKLGAERTVNVNVLTATYTAPEVQLLAAVPSGSIAYTAELINKTDSTDKANIGGTISLLAEPAKTDIKDMDVTVTGASGEAPVVGDTLTASVTDVDDANLDYTWTIGETPATGKTYEVKAADMGKVIKVKAAAKSDSADYTGTTADTELAAVVGKTLTVTAEDVTATYNGEAQTITVTVKDGETVINDATITYSATETGEYTNAQPEMKNAGNYTVYYKVNKDGYNEATGSATVTISKAAKPTITFTDDITENDHNEVKAANPGEKSTVVFTVSGADGIIVTAEEGKLNASAGEGLVDNNDGTWTATFADETKDVKFTASYAGDANHEPADGVQITIHVVKHGQEKTKATFNAMSGDVYDKGYTSWAGKPAAVGNFWTTAPTFTPDDAHPTTIKVAGTLAYVENFTGFNETKPNEQEGWYLPWQFAVPTEGETKATITIKNGESGASDKTWDMATDSAVLDEVSGTKYFSNLTAINGKSGSIVLVIDWDGAGENYTATEYTLDLTGVTFEGKDVNDGTFTFATLTDAAVSTAQTVTAKKVGYQTYEVTVNAGELIAHKRTGMETPDTEDAFWVGVGLPQIDFNSTSLFVSKDEGQSWTHIGGNNITKDGHDYSMTYTSLTPEEGKEGATRTLLYKVTADNASGADEHGAVSARYTVTFGATKLIYPDYNITKGAETNGTFTVAAKAKAGETVEITPAAAEGYTVKSVKFNGTDATEADGKYTFVMPAANVEVTVEFEAIPTHNVTWTASGWELTDVTNNGVSVATPTSPIAVMEGKDLTFKVNVTEAGKKVGTVTAGGETLTAAEGVYTITMGNADVALAVTLVDASTKTDISDKTVTVTGMSGTADAPKVGDTLTAAIDGVDAANLDFTWTVGGTAVAGTAATYEVKEADAGKAITVKAAAKAGNADYEGETAAAEVGTVEAGTVTPGTTYDVTVAYSPAGIASAPTVDKTTAAAGETVTVTAAAKTGYAVDRVEVLPTTDNSETEITANAPTEENANWTFTMPGEPVKVNVHVKRTAASTPLTAGTHKLDPTTLTGFTVDKTICAEELPAQTDNKFVADDMTMSTDGTKGVVVRINSKNAIYAVELKAKGKGSTSFTVAEGNTAKVTIVASSTGANNTSDMLFTNGGTMPDIEGATNGYTTFSTTTDKTLVWNNLPAGTYTLSAFNPAQGATLNSSGLRVKSIEVVVTEATPAPEKVTVTYEAKDAEGNAVTGVTLPAGGEVDKNTSVTLTAPTAPAGYTFDGWYVGETKITEDTYTVTADTTFTAKFTKNAVVTKPLTKIEVAATATVEAGKTAEVAVTLTPADTEDTVVVTSADDKIATGEIVDGKLVITGVAKGEVKLTLSGKTATDVKAEITVTVTEPVVELKDIVATVKNATAVYDGKAHGVTVTVTDPAEGAKITYAESETGTYSETPITITDAGEKTVWVKVEAEGYNPMVPKSATVTVTKAPVELTLTADKDNIHTNVEADREVTFAVAGLPEGATAAITCTGVTVTDGKVTLPDETKEYTFTATYAGDANHEAATATCVVNVTKSDEVNKVALDRAIKAAEADLDATVEDTDAANVPEGTKWALKADRDAYKVAIDAAKAIAEKADATQTEVDDAVTALATATTTFEAAKKNGTKPVELNTADLEKAITDAEAALKAAKDSENGDDVYTNETWISAADKHDLQDAIDAAKALLDDANATQEQIDAAKAAIDAAKAEIKNGNKSTGGGYRPSSGGSSAGTGTTTTATKPDGTKVVTETKKDGSVVTTQTKPDGTKVVTTADKDGNVTGTVTVPSNVDKTTVSVPVTDATTGMVPVIVKPDGTEEIIRNSSVEDGEVVFPMTESGTIKIVNNAKHFVDLDGHWAEDEANYVSARELFNGVDATHFAPDATMTRGMMATVLFRLDGENKSDKAADFSDVKAGDWFADAVEWASEVGVINGYTDGSFGPNKSITREELVVMVYRYAGAPKADAADMTGFNDADQVADWAAEAMNWAIKNGIINGRGNGVLDPKGNATRAEVSAVLERFVKLANQ